MIPQLMWFFAFFFWPDVGLVFAMSSACTLGAVATVSNESRMLELALALRLGVPQAHIAVSSAACVALGSVAFVDVNEASVVNATARWVAFAAATRQQRIRV